MQPHVDDLPAFLRAIDAYPAHLVGNSWGAFICLRAAIQEPAAVRSLILEAPPLVPLITGAPPAPAQIVKSLLRHPLATVATLQFAAGTVAPVTKLTKTGQVDASITRFAQGVLGNQAYDELPEGVSVHMRANASTHLGQAFADGGFEPITESQIKSVTAPALVVTGANSPPFLRRLGALLASLLPNSQSLEVLSASHIVHFEKPAAFTAGLLRFLAECPHTISDRQPPPRAAFRA